MFKSSYVEIDSSKQDEFREFIKKNAKNENFWKENKKAASRKVDKKKVDRLFEDN